MKDELFKKMMAGVVGLAVVVAFSFRVGASTKTTLTGSDSSTDNVINSFSNVYAAGIVPSIVKDVDGIMIGITDENNEVFEVADNKAVNTVNETVSDELQKESEDGGISNDRESGEDKCQNGTTESSVGQKSEDNKSKKTETSKYADVAIGAGDPYVNVRKTADRNADVVGKLYVKSVAKVISKKNGWAEIKSGNVKGYVNADYLIQNLSDQEITKKYAKQYAKVKTQTLNVRAKANKSSEVVGQLEEGKSLRVLKEYDEWVKVSMNGGKTGYLAKEYVSLSTRFTYAVTLKEEQKALEAKEKAAAVKKKASSKSNVAKVTKSTVKSTSKVETKKTESMSASERELMLLACIVYAESGGESYQGKLGVASVVINRCKSGTYPSTISGVIYQSGQFSPSWTGILDHEISKYKAGAYNSDSLRSESLKAAKAAIAGDNNVGNRTHFNGKAYGSGHGNVIIIGAHAFW